jgi:hypothetical protein
MPTTDSKLYKPGAPFLEAAPQVQPVACYEWSNDEMEITLFVSGREIATANYDRHGSEGMGLIREISEALNAAPPQPLDVQERQDRAVAPQCPECGSEDVYEGVGDFRECGACAHSWVEATSSAPKRDSTTESATSSEAKQLREALEKARGYFSYLHTGKGRHVTWNEALAAIDSALSGTEENDHD